MSLQTDIIFIRALNANQQLISQLPAGGVYSTSIPVPDEALLNADVPYIIVSFDGLQNEDSTKDDSYEGEDDRVQIGIEVVAQTRQQLGLLTTEVRRTIREFFESIDSSDEDYDLVPLDYTFTAQAVIYDPDKPSYGQVLNYTCDTHVD